MGYWAPPVYGKSKFYAKKKSKALKKIEKLNAIVSECDKHIAE